MDPGLLIENEDFQVESPAPHVLKITIISKPLGCFTKTARVELTKFLRKANEDNEVRCVILTGKDRSFSVGSNIKEFQASEQWIEDARLAETALNEIIELGRIPCIAAVNGFALGGGAVLALACDMRIAGRSAMFGVPEVKLGAIPTATGTMRLPLLIGRGNALKLMLTGEPITADQALSFGLYEEVVDDDQLQSRCLEIAVQITRVSPKAVALCRAAVSTALREGYLAGLRFEELNTVPLGLSSDAVEGKASFIEKRNPFFR